MANGVIEDALALAGELKTRFAGRSASQASAVIRIAHVLLVAEHEAQNESDFDLALAKLDVKVKALGL